MVTAPATVWVEAHKKNVDQATYGLADLGPDDLPLTRGVRGLEAPDTALVF